MCKVHIHLFFMEKTPKFRHRNWSRPFHLDEIFKTLPAIDWFEIISENYMDVEGKPLENLERILEHYTVVQHGVNLAIGSPTDLDWDYLKKLKNLTKKTNTPWLSDHLCWGRLPGAHYHDLLPLPYTDEVVDYVAERAKIIQDFLEIPFALENLSSYVAFRQDEMAEWEFYSKIVEKAGIFMMLDVNKLMFLAEIMVLIQKVTLKIFPSIE